MLATEERVAQRDHRFDPYVLPALGAFATAALGLTAKAAEKIGEHVLEVTEDVAHAIEALGAVQPRVPKAIVGLTLSGSDRTL